MKKLLDSKIVNPVLASILMVFAFYFGYLYRESEFVSYLHQFKPLRQKALDFPYVSPLVGTDSPNALTVGLFSNTEDKLGDLIKKYKKEGLVSSGIYYRDLNSAVWFGLNENEEFVPASLLKMTFALAAYKQNESDPAFFDKRFIYTQEIADETRRRNNAEVETSLVLGNSYSARDLVEIMLIKSDNGARDMLYKVVDQRYLNKVYTYLGIQEPSAVNDFKISTADYALFFRMLYSSTFINEEHSQDLLTILTKTIFPYGIRQSLPSRVSFAHKWGVYNFPKNPDGTQLQELHDCGIVYDPETPFLICIMTEGYDQQVLVNFMADVAKIIYEDVVGSRG